MFKLLIILIFITFILLCLIALTLFFFSARGTFIKGQSAWSPRNMPIKRKDKNLISKKDSNKATLLESISSQTNDYLNKKVSADKEFD